MSQRLPVWALSKSLKRYYWFLLGPQCPHGHESPKWLQLSTEQGIAGVQSTEILTQLKCWGNILQFCFALLKMKGCVFLTEEARCCQELSSWCLGAWLGMWNSACRMPMKSPHFLLGDSFSSPLFLCGCFQEHSDVLVCFLPGFARLLFLHGLLLSWVLILLFLFTLRGF